MKPDPRLLQLRKISDLIFDQKLATLQACAAARNGSLQRIRDLASKELENALEPIAQAQAQLRYETWADGRRADINLLLARQTVDWMEARKSAVSAFGRADVLRRLSEKSSGPAAGRSRSG